MDYYRETIKNAPRMIEVPQELRHRDFDVIFLTLDEKNGSRNEVEVDANGYPVGFFERTFGSIPDFPDREPQPPCDVREEIE